MLRLKMDVGAYDYECLLDHFYPEVRDEDEQIELLRRELCAADNDEKGYETDKVVIMREWVKAFAEQTNDHAKPLFEGLAGIEHDWTFVKYFFILVKHLWD